MRSFRSTTLQYFTDKLKVATQEMYKKHYAKKYKI